MTDNNTIQNSDSEYRNLLNGIKTVIESGRREAYASINHTAVITYWKIGQKIVEEEGTLNSLWCYHFPVPKSEIFYGNYRSIYLMIMSTKILNKILKNQSSNTLDLIICECHFCEFVYLLKFASNSLINRRSRESRIS